MCPSLIGYEILINTLFALQKGKFAKTPVIKVTMVQQDVPIITKLIKPYHSRIKFECILL